MDFITARLTGCVVTDHSMAAGTLAYSLAEKGWSNKVLDTAGIDRRRLPEILWAGDIAGTLTPQAAEDTGLTKECIVAVGGQDQKVAAYGARLDRGVATFSMGTCGAFEFLFDKPVRHPAMSLSTCPFVEPDKWVMGGCINTVGGAIKWLRDVICADLSYKEMDALAENVPPGSCGTKCYPFFTGKGTPHFADGSLAVYTGMALDTGRPELIRALYEGIAYETKMNIEAAEDSTGRISRLNAFSGASRSNILCRIVADVTKCTVRSYACVEMGNLGAARLAAKACGMDTADFGATILEAFQDRNPSENSGIHKSYLMII